MAAHDHHRHHHDHVPMDEDFWKAMVEQAELEGEVLARFVTDAASWIVELRDPEAPGVHRVIDIGSGPGVGTCELAQQFPDAHVVAVDSSPAMLERAARRADAHRLGERVHTLLAEMPDGLDALHDADLIWASMSLHHIGDETALLRGLRTFVEPSGFVAIAEVADPMHVLPDELDIGRPGLSTRLDRAAATSFAAMRDALADSVPSDDLASMLGVAGYEVVGSRVARLRLDGPLSDAARRMVHGHLRRTRDHYRELLDSDDLDALEVLLDVDDPRGVMHRNDVFVDASRLIVVARPMSSAESTRL